jgi:hypothetical protein
MLNLFVMHFLILFSLVIDLLMGWLSPKGQLDLVRILTPQKGSVLQGNIDIIGTATGIGFQYAEVSFRYQDSDAGDWFLIAQVAEIKVDDLLTNWDTSLIVDGDYQLRIQAYYEDGHQVESVIDDLRIRNYSPIETQIATPPSSSNLQNTNIPITITPSSSPTAQYATPLPPNEMVIEAGDLSQYAMRGAVIGILVLIVFGLWLVLRRRRIG